jgi:hypothetical protein
MTYLHVISDMYPGDSVIVNFPEGFELEYTKWTPDGDVIVKFNCAKLNVWYWDEDDHCCKDYYYYPVGDCVNSWTCKQRSLTEESKKKVWVYLSSLEYPYKN